MEGKQHGVPPIEQGLPDGKQDACASALGATIVVTAGRRIEAPVATPKRLSA